MQTCKILGLFCFCKGRKEEKTEKMTYKCYLTLPEYLGMLFGENTLWPVSFYWPRKVIIYGVSMDIFNLCLEQVWTCSVMGMYLSTLYTHSLLIQEGDTMVVSTS